MKEQNGYYVDENNNRWDCNLYSKEQAKRYSESLINCSDCSDCSHCSRCSDFKSNPMRICKSLHGTVKGLAQIYWIGNNVQCVFGCWKGKSIQEFRNKTKERLGDSDSAKEFYIFMDVAEYAIKKLN